MDDYLNNKAAANAALLARIHGIEPESEIDPDKPPDFDGGAREPVPLEEDPFQAHNATVLQFLQETRGGW
jgi:hypothetical protein